MTDHASPTQQTEQELREISNELLMASVLQELALSLPALGDWQNLLLEGATAAAMLLDTPRAMMFLLETEEQTLEAHGIYTYSAAGPLVHTIRVGQGIVGQIASSGKPALSNSPVADPRYNMWADSLGGVEPTALLGVPVQTKDQLLGVLVVADRERPFASRDMRWLTALANIIGGAYQNLRLIDELRQERERLVEAQEELRRKLARDLHDGATQRIAAVQMELEYMRRIARIQPDQIEREIDIMGEMLNKAMRMLRTAMFDLRPLLLETEGLIATLQRYVREHQGDRGAKLRLEIQGQVPQLRERAAAALFAIIQEAVTNARKHAGAKEIVICLREQEGEEGGELLVSIADDGRGFKLDEIETGYSFGSSFGMRNMRELVEALGGTLQVRSVAGEGTSINISMPRPV